MSNAGSPVIAAKSPSRSRWTARAGLAPWRRMVQAAMIAVLGQWSFLWNLPMSFYSALHQLPGTVPS